MFSKCRIDCELVVSRPGCQPRLIEIPLTLGLPVAACAQLHGISQRGLDLPSLADEFQEDVQRVISLEQMSLGVSRCQAQADRHESPA